MSSQPSWRPDVPGSQLFDEKTWLQGAILSTVAYGVNLSLFVLIISLLSTRVKADIKHNSRASRQTICLVTYVCVMFILSTLAMASQAEMTQLAFIENRDFPGGPAAYQELMYSIPIGSLGNYCLCLMNWFSDSLLLWRCSVIYSSSRTSRWLLMPILGLMLLASLVTGAMYLGTFSRSSSSPWADITLRYDVVHATVTIGLNILLTLLIVIRLYLHRRRFTKLLGRRHAAHYTGIISMLIESQAVPFVVALLFLILSAIRNRLANIPLVSMIQIQAVASYMIIFRVAKGTAWTSQTADSAFTIPDMPNHQGVLSNIRFQTTSVEHPTDIPATPNSQNQLPLDGPRDVLDIESSSRGSLYESSRKELPGVIEKARPNTM